MCHNFINKEGEDLIKSFETLKLNAYLCPAGIPTIGWGHTKDVKLGMQINEAQAQDLFNSDVKEFEEGVYKSLKNPDAISDNQFSAMVSLAFNIGLSNFYKSSVLNLTNRGYYKAAAACFILWCHSKGKKLNGLIRRRDSESKLYLKGLGV